jgi:hypothetical protein
MQANIHVLPAVDLSIEVVGDVGVVRITGDVDARYAPRFTEVVDELLGDGARSPDLIDIDDEVRLGPVYLGAIAPTASVGRCWSFRPLTAPVPA